jgi:hypothetical protein
MTALSIKKGNLSANPLLKWWREVYRTRTI